MIDYGSSAHRGLVSQGHRIRLVVAVIFLSAMSTAQLRGQSRIRFDVASGTDFVGDSWQPARWGRVGQLGFSRPIGPPGNRIQFDLTAFTRRAAQADSAKQVYGTGLRVSLEHASRHAWSLYEQVGLGLYGVVESKRLRLLDQGSPQTLRGAPALEAALGLRRAIHGISLGFEARLSQFALAIGTRQQVVSFGSVLTFGGNP